MPRAKKQQPVRAAPSQEYGSRVAQEEQQRAMPLPQVAGVPSVVPPVPASPPPSMVPLDAPTQRATEPITAGLPVGPGPGPEALGFQGNGLVDLVREAWQTYRSPALLDLLMDLEDRA